MLRARDLSRATAVLAAAVVLPLAGAPAAGADTLLDAVPQPTPVSAHAGRLLWSRALPAATGRTPRYVLVTRAGGVTSLVGVPSRTGAPFDADLGPDARGHVVAVYSRCRRAPGGVGSLPFPDWRTGRGCDVYRHDFTDPASNGVTGERRVAAVSSSSGSEYMPSLWGTRLAFARVYDRRREIKGQEPFVYLRDLRRGGRTRRVGRGPRGLYTRTDDGFEGGPGPTGLDLLGTSLAMGWGYRTAGHLRAQEVDLGRAGRPRRLIDSFDRFDEESNHQFTAPAAAAGAVLYGDFASGEEGVVTRWRRYGIRSGRRTEAEPAGTILPFAVGWDGTTLAFVHNPSAFDFSCSVLEPPEAPGAAGAGCAVVESSALRFRTEGR